MVWPLSGEQAIWVPGTRSQAGRLCCASMSWTCQWGDHGCSSRASWAQPGHPPLPVPTGPRPAQAGTVVSCSKQAGAPGRQQKAQVCPAPAGVWVRCWADFPAAGDEGLLGSQHCGVGAGRGERRPDKCAPAPHPTPSPSLSHEKLALKSGCSLQVRKFICWEAHLHWQLWASQGGRAEMRGFTGKC